MERVRERASPNLPLISTIKRSRTPLSERMELGTAHFATEQATLVYPETVATRIIMLLDHQTPDIVNVLTKRKNPVKVQLEFVSSGCPNSASDGFSASGKGDVNDGSPTCTSARLPPSARSESEVAASPVF